MDKYNYIVIGGNPMMTSYTGTITFTGLKVVGRTKELHDAEKLASENWEDCGGLIVVVDLNSGEIIYE